MDMQQYIECDTPDCVFWKNGGCAKETSVTIQEHHCVDYEERINLAEHTIIVEVSGGSMRNVYASPELPAISVELIDFDNLRDAEEEEQVHAQRMLDAAQKHYQHIF